MTRRSKTSIDLILTDVIQTLKGIQGIEESYLLPKSIRPKILELELEAEKSPQSKVRWFNKGLREVMRREIVVAIAHNPKLRHPPAPTIVLASGRTIVGEEVWRRLQIVELKKQSNSLFIGNTFVIYLDKLKASPNLGTTFILPALPFPELDQVKSIQNVVSGSPSYTTDLYIKKTMGWTTSDPKIGSVLIGFDITPQPNIL